MTKKTHHADIEEATESDNTTWVYILCHPDEHIEDPKWSKDWEGVDCKKCLKRQPTPPAKTGGE